MLFYLRNLIFRFPCQVRVRTVPLPPCRRHGKKRKDEEDQGTNTSTLSQNKKNNSREHSSQTGSDLIQISHVISFFTSMYILIELPILSISGYS